MLDPFQLTMNIDEIAVLVVVVAAAGILSAILLACRAPKAPPIDPHKYEARVRDLPSIEAYDAKRQRSLKIGAAYKR